MRERRSPLGHRGLEDNFGIELADHPACELHELMSGPGAPLLESFTA